MNFVQVLGGTTPLFVLRRCMVNTKQISFFQGFKLTTGSLTYSIPVPNGVVMENPGKEVRRYLPHTINSPKTRYQT